MAQGYAGLEGKKADAQQHSLPPQPTAAARIVRSGDDRAGDRIETDERHVAHGAQALLGTGEVRIDAAQQRWQPGGAYELRNDAAPYCRIVDDVGQARHSAPR